MRPSLTCLDNYGPRGSDLALDLNSSGLGGVVRYPARGRWIQAVSHNRLKAVFSQAHFVARFGMQEVYKSTDPPQHCG